MWSGSCINSTNCSTFGVSGSGAAILWTGSASSYIFEAGPNRTEQLVLTWKKNPGTLGSMQIYFKNNTTQDTCIRSIVID